MERVILVSGGLDSFAAYHYYKKYSPEDENLPLYIDYKGMYVEKEKETIKDLFGESVDVLSGVFDFSEHEHPTNAFIPNRNAFFALSVLFKYPDVNEIVMGGLNDDNVGDKSPDAFLRMEELLTEISGRRIYVTSPFWNHNKKDVVKFLVEEGLEEQMLDTCSCYHPSEERWCGECPACFRRFCAFLDASVIDPKMPFFKNTALMNQYLANIDDYDEDRAYTIEEAYNYSHRKIAQTFLNYSMKGNTYTNEEYVKSCKDEKVLAFDIDGTLTEEVEGFNPEAYLERTPVKKMIKEVRQFYKGGNKIILFTSRKCVDVEVTCRWLDLWEVPYHEIIFEKPHYDLFIDDKAKSATDFC